MTTWKSIAGLVLLLPTLVFAQETAKPFDVAKYSDIAFALVGNDYGTNVGVIAGSKGLLLIDPMPGEDALEELDALIKGISSKPILYVANTHNHQDHSGGNDYFNRKGASIFKLSGGKESSSSTNQNMELLNSFGLEVIEVKSHTSQDNLYYHKESNALFVGDVFDNSWHPTFYAGGIKGFTQTIGKILATGDENTIIVPGHGAPANKDVVKAFHENTLVWISRVTVLTKEKMSVEQMMEDKLIMEILQRFNTEQRKEFIPQRAFKRFIERTVSLVSAEP